MSKNKKEVFHMKKIANEFLNKVAKSAYATAKTEANSACVCFYYQPVMPKAVKELSKRK